MKNTLFKKRVKLFVIGFGIATFIGFMMTTIYVTEEIANNYYELTSKDLFSIFHKLTDELTASYAVLILIPIMVYFFKKVQLNKEKFVKHIIFYNLFSILIGLLHIGMMYSSRLILYPAFGFGEYDYGYIPIKIVMEIMKDFGTFWITFFVYTLYKTLKEKENQRIKNIQLEEQLTKARLETLKMQLNPHFLFNTLNMISSTMYEDLNAADKMLATLSDLLRITLKSSGKGLNSLENEIEILDLYIAIMKERFKDKLSIELNIDDDTLDALVPNFIFQPLVENSIKYGMENLSVTHVEVSSNKLNGTLQIQIKDNGPGIGEKSMKILSSGVGLSNTIERLDKLYGNNYDFNWENVQEGGLLLTIKIPFKVED